MKGLHIGDKVRIKDDNSSELKVGSIHTITSKWAEESGTVWDIDGWLFEESHLEKIEEGEK